MMRRLDHEVVPGCGWWDAGRMTTSPVTEFLTARWDEEQRLAEAATSGRWEVLEYEDFPDAHEIQADQSPAHRPRTQFTMVTDNDGLCDRADAIHIARHDPARVLADIAAKRKLLEIWRQMHDHISDDFATNSFAEDILEQLLAPYGKRAVFTRTGNSGPLSWHLEDVAVSADV